MIVCDPQGPDDWLPELKAPKASDVEVEVKAPKAPDVEVEVKAPKAPDVEVEVKAPSMDVEELLARQTQQRQRIRQMLHQRHALQRVQRALASWSGLVIAADFSHAMEALSEWRRNMSMRASKTLTRDVKAGSPSLPKIDMGAVYKQAEADAWASEAEYNETVHSLEQALWTQQLKDKLADLYELQQELLQVPKGQQGELRDKIAAIEEAICELRNAKPAKGGAGVNMKAPSLDVEVEVKAPQTPDLDETSSLSLSVRTTEVAETYSGLGRLKLIKLCKERGIEYKPVSKDVTGLIALLQENDTVPDNSRNVGPTAEANAEMPMHLDDLVESQQLSDPGMSEFIASTESKLEDEKMARKKAEKEVEELQKRVIEIKSQSPAKASGGPTVYDLAKRGARPPG